MLTGHCCVFAIYWPAMYNPHDCIFYELLFLALFLQYGDQPIFVVLLVHTVFPRRVETIRGNTVSNFNKLEEKSATYTRTAVQRNCPWEFSWGSFLLMILRILRILRIWRIFPLEDISSWGSLLLRIFPLEALEKLSSWESFLLMIWRIWRLLRHFPLENFSYEDWCLGHQVCKKKFNWG